MHSKNANIKYIISLLVSLVGAILIVAAFGVLSMEKNPFSTLNLIKAGLLGGIGMMFIIGSKPIRIEARQQAATDEYGNKKQGYAHLSAQERKMVDLQIMAENEAALSDSEFRTMRKPGSKSPDEDLKKMIGMPDVKQKILELKSQMEYVDKKDRKAFHMCFLGNPGTGKTTVAKILTGYLYKFKYIKTNEIISTDASSLLASGNPTKRIQLLLARSHGKVLFIDEAYALAFDRSGVGNEVLATLLNEMENSRDSLIVILAGYKDEMKMLFNMNSGLQSRINNYIFFEDYTIEEMKDILHGLLISKNMDIDVAAEEKMLKMLFWQQTLPTFANARTVRKIFESAISRHYYNLNEGIIPQDKRNTIVEDDIVENLKENEYFAS